jgi:type I restriction enzyme R subunit
VYDYTRPVNNAGRLLWHAFGAKTQALIDANVVDGTQSEPLENIVLNPDLLDNMLKSQIPVQVKSFEVKLFERVRSAIHSDQKPEIRAKFEALGEALELLKERAEQKLITSLEFIKGLATYSQELLQLERNEKPQDKDNTHKKAALSELLAHAKYNGMPIIVEEIISDIDEGIVKYVNFKGWYNNAEADRDVKKALLMVLKKYALQKDRDLTKRMYDYIKEYY